MEDPEDEPLWQDFDALIFTLGDDMLDPEERATASSDQLWRRAFCRSLFVFLEAIIDWMRRYTLEMHDGVLGDREKEALRSRSSALGRTFTALDLFTNVAGASTFLAKGSREWELLRRSIQIRNRLTHPQSASDIVVSDDDLRMLVETKDLIVSVWRHAFTESANAMLAKAAKIEAMWKVKRGEPGATDNPDDAQRLREDH